MSIFVENLKVAAAAAGHLPPQSVNAAATASPQATTGYVAGTTLIGRALLCTVQTGAFTSTPSMGFKLSYADDANGTNPVDYTGGAIATIAAANTAGAAELPITIIADLTKFVAIRCLATGGTSGFVAGQLRILDPNYSA
jgi:hypothetical protein